MKEFEKQWVEHNGGETHETSCMSHIGYPEAAKFWRAALESMLKNKTFLHVYNSKPNCDGFYIPIDVIEKELEGL